MSLTIKADAVYRAYADHDPKTLFEKATQYMASLAAATTSDAQDILKEGTNEAILHAIYGSNRIEKAGLGYDATLHLFQQLLRGEPVPDIDETDIDYESELAELIAHDKDLQGQPAQNVLRGRREIIQHVRAYRHILARFVVCEDDMTEDLIKETHAILCKNVSILDPEGEVPEVPAEEYAGKYRNVHVGAGSTMFMVPKFVPERMREMCDSLKTELEEAQSSGSIDPFSMAAKYSLRFVEIHPFQDGNGRICRIILNTILFRYVGIIVPIGEQDEDHEEYMGIKKRASANMEGHGEYATYVLGKSVKAIQELKRKVNARKKA